MAESFYVGAYWGARGEPVEDCACRLARFLAALRAVDPLLGSWFEKANSRKAALERRFDVSSVAALRELLLAGQLRRDDEARSVMTELGYGFSAWNGQDAEATLSVRCGAPASIPGMTSNVVAVELPEAEGEGLRVYRRDAALAVVRATVATWQPSWCTWTSHRLRKAQGRNKGAVVVGWTTYIADVSGLEVNRLPAGVTTEPLDRGLLITAAGDADSATETTVLAVRNALGTALHQGA